MKQLVSPGRMLLLSLFLLALTGLYVVRLYQLQIVEGEAAYEASTNSIVSYETVAAARGNILDRYGRLLVSNRNCNNLVIDDETLFENKTTDQVNADILAVCRILEACGDSYNDELPITTEPPFEFTEHISDIQNQLLQAWLSANGLRSDASAVEIMAKMRSRYDIDNSYSAEEMRTIAGIRYAVNARYNINTSDYIFAEDVSIQTITALLESGIEGFDVTVSYIREYNTIYAAHILGYTGLMTGSEYETYSAEGYAFNAQVGKDGAELAFESYLHGTDGTAAVTRTGTGVVTSTVYRDSAGNDTSPQPGNHVYLTIDIELQAVAENALKNFIETTNEERLIQNQINQSLGKEEDDLITGGALVSINCQTGEPLCLASYPSYDLSTLLEDYSELLEDSRGPLTNRALLGLYSPGSTFKLCVALAGLEEGVIDTSSTIDCTGRFTEYEVAGYTPYCWNKYGHGELDLKNAIINSCNIYFFTVGDRLGQEKIYDYATRLGMGQRTGIELPETAGHVASPEYKAQVYAGTQDADWFSGDTLQMAIGQSVTQITPLQIARYVAAVANGGTVYNCSILKSVSSYDYSDSLYERQPDVYGTVEAEATVWDTIHEGMYGVTHDPNGSAYATFYDFTPATAGKTGTTQTTGTNDGLFVCYSPFDDPEIVTVVVIEKAGWGADTAALARELLEYYYSFTGSTTQIEEEMTLLA